MRGSRKKRDKKEGGRFPSSILYQTKYCDAATIETATAVYLFTPEQRPKLIHLSGNIKKNGL
jgi:hypothetical protein